MRNELEFDKETYEWHDKVDPHIEYFFKRLENNVWDEFEETCTREKIDYDTQQSLMARLELFKLIDTKRERTKIEKGGPRLADIKTSLIDDYLHVSQSDDMIRIRDTYRSWKKYLESKKKKSEKGEDSQNLTNFGKAVAIILGIVGIAFYVLKIIGII